MIYQPGVYEAIITGNGIQTSSKKQTPGVYLLFQPQKTVDGEDVSDGAECRIDLWMSPNNREIVIKQLRELGWTGADPSELRSGGYQLKGKNTRVVCYHEEWEGNIRAKWRLPMTGNDEDSDAAAEAIRKLYGVGLRDKRPPEDDIPF